MVAAAVAAATAAAAAAQQQHFQIFFVLLSRGVVIGHPFSRDLGICDTICLLAAGGSVTPPKKGGAHSKRGVEAVGTTHMHSRAFLSYPSSSSSSSSPTTTRSRPIWRTIPKVYEERRSQPNPSMYVDHSQIMDITYSFGPQLMLQGSCYQILYSLSPSQQTWLAAAAVKALAI